MKYLSYRIRRNGFKAKRVGKINYKSIVQQVRHDLRLEQMNDGYLKDTSKKNIYTYKKGLVDDIDGYLKNEWEKCKSEYLEHHGRSLDKRTQPYLTHILSFSSGFFPDDPQKLHNVVKEFVKEYFGDFISIASHLDETSLHIHIITKNFDERTKKTIGRNIDTSNLQDLIEKWLIKNNVDYGHRRGISKTLTRTKHHEVLESRKIALNKLQKEIETKQQINDDLNNTIDFIKQEYNNLVMQYQSLSKQMGKMIHDIYNITDDTRTVKKLEKIENLLRENFNDLNTKQLSKLLERMNKGQKTLQKVSNAIQNKLDKAPDNE